MSGRFITLEGPEGAGKTLMAERLAGALRARGLEVRLTREPGGTRLGEQVRSIVLARAQDGDEAIDARADALLFNAARAQLVAEVIRPALAAGEVVVCARFADSTLAYQGYGRGLDLARVRALDAEARDGIVPAMTFLFDCPVEEGLARARARAGSGDRFEREVVSFHERVRHGFQEMARAEPARFRVLDSAAPIDQVHAAVVAETERRLG